MDRGTTYRTTPLKSALILIGVLGGTIAFAFWFIGYLAPDPGGAAMTGHGTTALVLGVIFSIILGVGLMALVFLSNRRGYDENAHRQQDTRHLVLLRQEIASSGVTFRATLREHFLGEKGHERGPAGTVYGLCRCAD